MTVKETLKRQETAKLHKLVKTFEASKGLDEDFDNDLCTIINRLEAKIATM